MFQCPRHNDGGFVFLQIQQVIFQSYPTLPYTVPNTMRISVNACLKSYHYLGIYAFSPIVNGFPSTMQDVFILPLVLATTSVFPDALGVGVSRSHVIMSLFPSILVSIAMCVSSAYRRPILIRLQSCQ